MNMIQCH